MQIKIDGNCFNNAKELHSYLKEKLSFPDYYGENLDALYDVMMDIRSSLVIEASNMEKYPGFLEVFEDLAADNPNISLKLS